MRLQEQTNTAKTISRRRQFALFLTAMAWAAAANAIAARAARGISDRLQISALMPLLESLFLIFLAVIGFRALDWIAIRGRYAAEALPLPRRAGWQREWGTGAAIGWGLCIATVLPVLLTGHLHATLTYQRGTLQGIAIPIATLAAAALAEEIIFRGYPFRRLIAVLGPSWAAVLLSILFYVLMVQANPPHNFLLALIDTTLFGLLLAMAWLRTHALWLGWGLHFAYRAVAAVVLGLPIAGHGEFGSPVDMYATGPRWLSGGAFGLDAALLTSLVMLAGMIVLYRETRDYAWKYTHDPIIAAGYEVTIAPPAAHIAMENSAPPPPPLIQILPSTPQTRSTIELPLEFPPR